MLLCMICESMFLLLIESAHTITTVVSCYCFFHVKTRCFVLFLYVLNLHIFIMPLHNLEKAPRQCRTLVCQIVNYYNTYSYTLDYISALLQLNVEYIYPCLHILFFYNNCQWLN